MPPSWFRREIGIGDFGPDVNIVRRKLGLPTGQYTAQVAALIRGLCERYGLKVSSEVTAEVAGLLGETEARIAGLTPEWYVRELRFGDEGPDVHALRLILGLPGDPDRLDIQCSNAVRRFQSGSGLKPTGVVDAELALLLGEGE